ncbi:MAG TPA: hypothetical protein VGA37_06830 [Gemmatimonadales bacterium]
MRVVVLLVLWIPLSAQQPTNQPCRALEYRQFDFWIGTWDVFNPAGERVGTNTIDTVLGGCALHEAWTGTRGYPGFSYNIWDQSRGLWHQTWVSGTGNLLMLEGGWRDGSMVLEGQVQRPQGPVRNRIVWTPLAPDSVRQHWQTWNDSQGVWATTFDGLYVRKRD